MSFNGWGGVLLSKMLPSSALVPRRCRSHRIINCHFCSAGHLFFLSRRSFPSLFSTASVLGLSCPNKVAENSEPSHRALHTLLTWVLAQGDRFISALPAIALADSRSSASHLPNIDQYRARTPGRQVGTGLRNHPSFPISQTCFIARR